MDANAPIVVEIPVCCAPKKAPCPFCGKLGKRVRTHPRRVRTIAYHKIVFLDITVGDNGVYPAKAGYDNATGLGVPDVANLIKALTAAK